MGFLVSNIGEQFGGELRDACINTAASVVDGEWPDAFESADEVVGVCVRYFLTTDAGGYSFVVPNDWPETTRMLCRAMARRGELLFAPCDHPAPVPVPMAANPWLWCPLCGALQTGAGEWLTSHDHQAGGR